MIDNERNENIGLERYMCLCQNQTIVFFLFLKKSDNNLIMLVELSRILFVCIEHE